MNDVRRYFIKITGIVQGVGFRPYVYTQAKDLSLQGWVNNSAEGVLVDIEGPLEALELFVGRIRSNPPPLAEVKRIDIEEKALEGFSDFIIKESSGTGRRNVYISGDIAVCEACRKEFLDPDDRRHLYPFINCTHCGPRFTIVRGIPYDRVNTTMAPFAMCSRCASEYKDPLDRRYHAQPVSCPDCGPTLQLRPSPSAGKEDTVTGMEAAKAAQTLLSSGAILAVKGLGGYHLACDAANGEAVMELRKRKIRDDKPFAVMIRDFETVQRYCPIREEEKALLLSREKPIVILDKREDCTLPGGIAPGNATLGVMLPYTPLHLLLFQGFTGGSNPPEVLVMTSANRSSEPIAYIDADAFENLGDIADYFLFHDREIYIRTDDSVTRVFQGREYMLRRSRGYVPQPLTLEFLKENIPVVLACGGEQKNTFCLNKGQEFFISHHIGDLENLETLTAFEEGICHFNKIFSLEPTILAYDLHPEYLSSKYAEEADLGRKIPIQHHHAHIASCMAENGLWEPVIGVAFDGTGYGEDGLLWGGEFFSGSYGGFVREGHLAYIPMPGGEMAVKEPWRMAVSYLWKVFGSVDEAIAVFPEIGMEKLHSLGGILEKKLQCPMTSGAGRLFDAVAALVGVRNKISYEGQAAIELEHISEKKYCGEYGFDLAQGTSGFEIQVGQMIGEILADLKAGVSKGVIGAKFHETVANIIVAGCRKIREKTGLCQAALSGGVFQNIKLLNNCITKLQQEGFTVHTHHRVPTNDGGISLGQSVIAIVRSQG